MHPPTVVGLPARWQSFAPGLAASLVVAGAASFLVEHYHAPVMLFALLLGMAMNFLSDGSKCQPGIEFTAREVLRVGVALLGIRVTLGEMAALGWQPLLLVLLSLTLTIALSMLAARLLGFNVLFGLLTGGATAICGASAALALAAALPTHPVKERATLFTVTGVSALSTLAMICYPMLMHVLGYSGAQAGVFLGATIHDVAQVVGAGYGKSQQTGDVATVVKLMRVAMLLPVILCTTLWCRASGALPPGAQRPPLLPWFALGFLALAAINSTGWLPAAVQQAGGDLSPAAWWWPSARWA
jgi:uncharacterized integral membrane protein (TIGR00698 family)